MLTVAFIVFAIYLVVALFVGIFGAILFDICLDLEIYFEDLFYRIKKFFNKGD